MPDRKHASKHVMSCAALVKGLRHADHAEGQGSGHPTTGKLVLHFCAQSLVNIDIPR